MRRRATLTRTTAFLGRVGGWRWEEARGRTRHWIWSRREKCRRRGRFRRTISPPDGESAFVADSLFGSFAFCDSSRLHPSLAADAGTPSAPLRDSDSMELRMRLCIESRAHSMTTASRHVGLRRSGARRRARGTKTDAETSEKRFQDGTETRISECLWDASRPRTLCTCVASTRTCGCRASSRRRVPCRHTTSGIAKVLTRLRGKHADVHVDQRAWCAALSVRPLHFALPTPCPPFTDRLDRLLCGWMSVRIRPLVRFLRFF